MQANKGKCPLGSESGSENHFDDMKDAEVAYAKQQGVSIPKTLNEEKAKEAVKKKFRHSFRRSAEELLGDDDIPIHYDQEEGELKSEFDKVLLRMGNSR